MPKYRRIPDEPIEAFQWFSHDENPPAYVHVDGIGYFVVTIHGQHAHLADGDWILPEPDGKHYYPCNPDVFSKTYESVETPEFVMKATADALMHGVGAVNVPFMMMVDGLDAADAADMRSPGHIQWIPDGPLSPAGWVPASVGGPGPDDPQHPNQRAARFRDELQQAINRHSMENGSDTPDFILAEYLATTLMAFDAALRRRDDWYGGSHSALKAQLEAEGEHTAAANARIDEMQRKLDGSLLDGQ